MVVSLPMVGRAMVPGMMGIPEMLRPSLSLALPHWAQLMLPHQLASLGVPSVVLFTDLLFGDTRQLARSKVVSPLLTMPIMLVIFTT